MVTLVVRPRICTMTGYAWAGAACGAGAAPGTAGRGRASPRSTLWFALDEHPAATTSVNAAVKKPMIVRVDMGLPPGSENRSPVIIHRSLYIGHSPRHLIN